MVAGGASPATFSSIVNVWATKDEDGGLEIPAGSLLGVATSTAQLDSKTLPSANQI